MASTSQGLMGIDGLSTAGPTVAGVGHEKSGAPLAFCRFLIFCFCSRIREAIAINKVAAIFVAPEQQLLLLFAAQLCQMGIPKWLALPGVASWDTAEHQKPCDAMLGSRHKMTNRLQSSVLLNRSSHLHVRNGLRTVPFDCGVGGGF